MAGSWGSMNPRKNVLGLVAALVFLSWIHCTNADPLVDELLSMQLSAPQGVMALDDDSFQRFVTKPRSRSYNLLIFFDSKDMWNKPGLKLRELRREFFLASKAFLDAPQDPAGFDDEKALVFFAFLELKHSREAFMSSGVNSLPFVRLVRSGAGVTTLDVDFRGGTPQTAEGIVSFVESNLDVKAAPIKRPPPISSGQLAAMGSVTALVLPLFIRTLLKRKTVFNDPRLWCFGAVVVYFFSVSGVMFNIIRGMPFAMPNRDNPRKIEYFLRGGQQLGAEGFAAGGLFTVSGLILAFATHVAPRFEKSRQQRLILIGCFVAGYLAVMKLLSIKIWKGHYGAHFFWPSWL